MCPILSTFGSIKGNILITSSNLSLGSKDSNNSSGEFKNRRVQNGLYNYYINYQTYGNPKEQILGKVLLIN